VEDQHEHIDLTTLREVERLLTSTEFASADDLAQRGFSAGGRSSVGNVDPAGGSAAPLPKRR
jgi:hypothetical protein